MPTVDLTAVTFTPTVRADGIALVDFWASWCGPCRMFAPVYDTVAAAHPDIVFGKVDTENEQELALSLNIRSIPTLMLFRDGILLFRESGVLPESELVELIRRAGELDMDAVRSELGS